jgi:hypothetical protein
MTLFPGIEIKSRSLCGKEYFCIQDIGVAIQKHHPNEYVIFEEWDGMGFAIYPSIEEMIKDTKLDMGDIEACFDDKDDYVYLNSYYDNRTRYHGAGVFMFRANDFKNSGIKYKN